MDTTILELIMECIDRCFEVNLMPKSHPENYLSEEEINKRADEIKTVLTLYIFKYIDARSEMCKKMVTSYKNLVETLRKEERK